jgi:putative transposase
MKRSKFSEEQIAYALKQNELGNTVDEVCRKMGISEATFYLWKKKYQNLGPSEVRRLRQLEEENRKLKQIVGNRPSQAVLTNAVAFEVKRRARRGRVVRGAWQRACRRCAKVVARRLG